MKGFRTLLVNAAFVAIGAVLPWAAGIDWTQYVSPTAAVVIMALINGAMRLVTTTPVGKP